MPDSSWSTEIVRQIAKSFHVLLLLIGTVLFLVGGVGRFRDWFDLSPASRYAIGGLGVLMILGGIIVWLVERAKTANLKEMRDRLNLEIHAPMDMTLVGPKIDATGTLAVKRAWPLPDGYSLRALRGYPKNGGWVPEGLISVDEKKGSWSIYDFAVGGEPGRVPNDRRTLDIWLVGRNGDALLNCWTTGQASFRNVVGKSVVGLPPIARLTDDMILCAQIRLQR